MTYDTYFNDQADYPLDAGLTIGVLPGKLVQLEVGFDLFYPTFASGEPVGLPGRAQRQGGRARGRAFQGLAGLVGGRLSALGFEEDVTDYNVLYAVVGKTFPHVGTLSAGRLLRVERGPVPLGERRQEQTGALAGWVVADDRRRPHRQDPVRLGHPDR